MDNKISTEARLERVNTEHDEKSNIAELRGHAIQGQEHSRSWLQSLQKDPKLLFWIGVMLWTLIVRGFENQSSSSVISIPAFQKAFGQPEADGDYFIATSWQSGMSGGSNATAIIGAVLASYLADIFGVKPVILGFALLNQASVAIEFASTSITMYMIGKLLNFVAIGGFLNLCTAYVADVTPLAIRASTIGFCNLSQCIGPFISAIMSYYTESWTSSWSWKSLIATQWGFCAVSLVALVFMPESPTHLVRKNKLVAARASLGRLYSDPADADGHLEQIKLTLEEAETQRRSTYMECFRGTNKRRTLIAILVFLAEPMSGLGFVSNFGALFYERLGIGSKESFKIQIGAQILSISGATIACFVGDFYGRRPMYLGGCCGLVALMFCMGISGSFDTAAASTASVGFYTIFNFAYNIGVGSIVYTIAAEIPTSALRQKTLAISISISAAANTMWSFACPYIFDPGYGDLEAKIGFIFGGIMLIWFGMGYMYVPETRRRTYEELDELFLNHVPARKFKGYETESERRATEAYAGVASGALYQS